MHRRQRGQACRQSREVTRPRAAQGDARQDPLEVGDVAEGVAQALGGTGVGVAAVEQGGDRVVAGP